MKINKKELTEKFLVEKDFDYVIKKAQEITKFLLTKNYKIIDQDLLNDLTQTCLTDLWEKILKGKHEKYTKNIFSFIWQNSNYKIKDVMKGVTRRNGIVKFISTDEFEMDFEDKR